MFTPPPTEIITAAATHAVSVVFLRTVAVHPTGSALRWIYVDSSDAWTTSPPSSTAPAFEVSSATQDLLTVGGVPSASGEGWVAPSGKSYRLVAVTDAAGARHGIAVAVGPTDPPIV